jgi:hypothetical protein
MDEALLNDVVAAALKAGADAAEAAWVPLDEIAHLRLADGLAEFLHEHGIVPVIA